MKTTKSKIESASKRIKRMLLLALSVSLIISATLPLESAYAAPKITLKSGKPAPSTIYVRHSYTLKVPGVKAKFYSSEKKVATIGVTTGKMKLVRPGKVTITAKDSKTGKVAATKTFTVLERANSISAVEKTVIMEEGEKYTLTKPILVPETSTDVIQYASTDASTATVGSTSGKITAKRATGSATINIYAKATKTTARASKNNKVTTVKVEVYKTPIKDLEQTSPNTLDIVVGKNVPQTSNLSLTEDGTEKSIDISSIVENVEAGENAYTLLTVENLKPGASYTLTYGDCTRTFVAKEGVIKELIIDAPISLSILDSADIKLKTMDEENNNIYTYVYGEKFFEPIEFTAEVMNGEITDGKLTFNSSNGVAKLKAVYTPKDSSEIITVERTVYAYIPSYTKEPEKNPQEKPPVSEGRPIA